MLREALPDPAHWLGALPRNPAFALPERHLGLVAAAETGDGLARIDALADALADTPLGQLTPAQLQRWSVTFPAPKALPMAPAPALQGRTIAVARDSAFCFIYPANLDCLRGLGAQLVFFSPLEAQQLPPCDAVWLPGGYPELHADRLAANHGLRDSLHLHVAQGRPLWAECGGMMALFEQLRTADGRDHALWGLLPGRVSMQPQLAALGPQQLVLDGLVLRGHTFHYSTCETPLVARVRTSRPGSPEAPGQGEALFERGALRASYFHAWFASSPQAVARLFKSEEGNP
jgi:cobyrinic acid a,c-diamide synthase